jgi:peptide/nickel transport system permease protein
LTRYIVQRLIWSGVVLLGVSMIVFVITYVVPADPAHMIAGPRASPEVLKSIRHQLALDQPLPVQYVRYMSNLLHGSLGTSWRTKREVGVIIAERIPATLQLALAAILVQLLIGLPVGLVSAVRRGTWPDRLGMIASLVLVAAPTFWLGLILLYLFAFKLPIFPLGGYGSLAHLFLPAFTLGIAGAAWYARLFRSTVLDVLNADYVRTARAKGLRESVMLVRHVVPNSILPVIAMLGMDLGTLLGGVVIVETVFGWPGLGQLAWQALRDLDVPIIMGTVLLAGLAMVLINLLTDLSFSIIDPRIRYE